MSPQEFLKIYENALATHTWEAVEPLIYDSCAFVFSEGTYVGKEEVGKAITKTFSKIKNEKYAIQNVQWIVSISTIATCIYDFSWEGYIDGKLKSGRGRGTSVLIAENSRWYICNEHLGPIASLN